MPLVALVSKFDLSVMSGEFWKTVFPAAALQSDTLALLYIVPSICEGRFNFLPLGNNFKN